MAGVWDVGEGGVLSCRCAEGFSAHALALAAQQQWLHGGITGRAFSWLLELPGVCLSEWQRVELAAVLREALTARTLPGAVVVLPGDEEWLRQQAWSLARETGGVLGVFVERGEAQEWARQQALVFIGESVWRVRELANTLHRPVSRPRGL